MHFIINCRRILSTCYDIYEVRVQQLEQRYARDEKFREKKDRTFKHTCLKMNSPLAVELLGKVTKIKKDKAKNIL